VTRLKRRRPATPSRVQDGATPMLDQWIAHCLLACHTPATLYSGSRKIIRPMTLVYPSFDDSIQLSDAGYTSNKLRMLTTHYVHKESQDVAVQLWNKRKGQGKYGSVGFTTYAHFVKGGGVDAKRSKRASVFGPCIQSAIITLLTKKTYSVDVFYRTTELFKKFPADLVLIRDVLLKPFDFSSLEFRGMTCHFASVTAHPMYFVTIIPHMKDPIKTMESLKKGGDRFFYNWVVKWTARYLCPEHGRGIQKFSQAVRVRMDAERRIPRHTFKQLQVYLRKNHPGFRNTYQDPEEDDAD
jgi:hypothetical protein